MINQTFSQSSLIPLNFSAQISRIIRAKSLVYGRAIISFVSIAYKLRPYAFFDYVFFAIRNHVPRNFVCFSKVAQIYLN